MTGALLWAIVSALGHTALAPSFDLAGVTGLIVSIGITVDSYIVYFERLKDETRAGPDGPHQRRPGLPERLADRAGRRPGVAGRAPWCSTCWPSATCRGFAFFLGLSTLLDIFITYFFTRPLVILLGRTSG